MNKSNEIRIVLPFTYQKGDKGYYINRPIETDYDAAQEALEEISNGLEMPEVEPDVRFDASKIDWEELKKQKTTLLKVIDENTDIPTNYNLCGILDMIDAIQDHAVDVMGLPENKVFDLQKD